MAIIELVCTYKYLKLFYMLEYYVLAPGITELKSTFAGNVVWYDDESEKMIRIES